MLSAREHLANVMKRVVLGEDRVGRNEAALSMARSSLCNETRSSPTRLFHPPASLGIFSSERRVVAQTYKHLSGSTGEVSCCRMPGMDPQKVLLEMIEPAAGVICCSESEPSLN